MKFVLFSRWLRITCVSPVHTNRYSVLLEKIKTLCSTKRYIYAGNMSDSKESSASVTTCDADDTAATENSTEVSEPGNGIGIGSNTDCQPTATKSENIPYSEQVCSKPEETSQALNGNSGSLSKRALKKLRREERIRKAKERKSEKNARKEKNKDVNDFGSECAKETSYYFENGLRKVHPYYFKFRTYAKGRWFGKNILDIFKNEFHMDEPDSCETAIRSGSLTVNGQTVDATYTFKDNDYIENKIHRHELPVTAEAIKIVEHTDDVVVVNKPSSIPVHPCGRYRHNSLLYILARDNNIHNLRGLYRLDRLTSGLMIFGKTEEVTSRMMVDIRERRVEKEYVCKVEGHFPSEPVVCEQPLDVLSHKCGIFRVSPKGKVAKTTFERIASDGSTSIVKCKPHTGRTHQIRVHLQFLGFPIMNDPMYNSSVWGPHRGKGGDYGKPVEKLVEDLLAAHSRDQHVEAVNDTRGTEGGVPDKRPPPVANCEDQQAKKQKLETTTGEENSGTAEGERGQITYDPDCRECRTSYRDPTPEQLIMYLHAYRYKGTSWEYSTPFPPWATYQNLPSE